MSTTKIFFCISLMLFKPTRYCTKWQHNESEENTTLNMKFFLLCELKSITNYTTWNGQMLLRKGLTLNVAYQTFSSIPGPNVGWAWLNSAQACSKNCHSNPLPQPHFSQPNPYQNFCKLYTKITTQFLMKKPWCHNFMHISHQNGRLIMEDYNFSRMKP